MFRLWWKVRSLAAYTSPRGPLHRALDDHRTDAARPEPTAYSLENRSRRCSSRDFT